MASPLAFPCLLLAVLARVLPVSAEKLHIHMVTFTTEMYEERFAESLKAKEAYARRWGYGFEVFNEETLRCDGFRPHRWRGDYRYCKLEALKATWSRVAAERKRQRGRRDFIFWHDVDTHIMRPETPLETFLEAAGPGAAVVFTENALSLNNGVFFLEMSKQGSAFLKAWRKGCRGGEWPWADNGCMYEVLLNYLGGERYSGHCSSFREPDFNPSRPEPPTGSALMDCFNEEMGRLGMGCCGGQRKIKGFAFLQGEQEAFNHHPCHELERSREFESVPLETIRQHCFLDGMFMVHSKNVSYVEASRERVEAFLAVPLGKEEL